MKQHMIFVTIALIVGAHSAAAKVDADKTQQAVVQFLSDKQGTELHRVIGIRSTDDSAKVFIEAIRKGKVVKGKFEFLKMDDGSWYMMGAVVGRGMNSGSFKENLDQAYDLD